MVIPHNPNYIHHTQGKISSALLREIVFGLEDGMVSTLGAVTGIATATGSQFSTLLSGLVVVSVESISMAVGSYLSNKSEKDTDNRKLFEEKDSIVSLPGSFAAIAPTAITPGTAGCPKIESIGVILFV